MQVLNPIYHHNALVVCEDGEKVGWTTFDFCNLKKSWTQLYGLFAFQAKKPIFALMDNDKVKYWIDLSDYDYDTADAMFRTGRWLYVGFMCHQCIEKIFKAYWSKKKSEPTPYSHNLINLAQSCGLGQLLNADAKN